MIDKVYNGNIINYNIGKKDLALVKDRELSPVEQSLMKACIEFETVLAKQMLAVVQTSNFFGKGFGGEFFQDMFQDELAKSISSRGLGLAENMYSQLIKTELLRNK